MAYVTMEDCEESNLFCAYVTNCADYMGLKDWTIYVNRKFKITNKYAGSCEKLFGRNVAYIKFNDGFLKYGDFDKRQTIIHELTHCLVAGMNDCIIRDLPYCKEVSKSTYKLFDSVYNREMETAVDRIAVVIAKAVPLFEDYKEMIQRDFKPAEYDSFFKASKFYGREPLEKKAKNIKLSPKDHPFANGKKRK